jgi:hypothetical protein
MDMSPTETETPKTSVLGFVIGENGVPTIKKRFLSERDRLALLFFAESVIRELQAEVGREGVKGLR